MSHFLVNLGMDARMLYRNGYAAGVAVVFAVLLILVLQIATVDFAGFADIIAALVLVDVAVSCLILIGLMILLERSEGTILALAATPMSPRAYLASKTVAIAILTTLQTILLVLIAYDGAVSVPLLLGGLFGMAMTATLLGILVVAPYDTVFRFLLPMIGAGFFLSVPAYGVLFDWHPNWLDLHPLAPSMSLLEGAFEAPETGRLIYGLVGAVTWLGVAWAAASWAFKRLRLSAAGG